MIYIVGSGLSAIAAAVALVKRNIRPTILDAGLRPDSEILDLKARLNSVEPDFWQKEDIERLKRMGPAGLSGIPQKLHFGSNFASRDLDSATAVQFRDASILRSFARGGLSNVWGGVIQPWPQEEFQDWPAGIPPLGRHYDAVRNLISSDVPVQASTQARTFHHDLAEHRPELDREGVRFGYAKLAVRSVDNEVGKGCRGCGLCLYGCPYDSIFSAASQLERMIRMGHISYVPGVLVDRISSDNNGIRIEGRSTEGSGPRSFDGQSVFLAAGLLESARIILNSTNRAAIPLCVHQSDIFTLPMLRYRSAREISRERIHTLCQVVVEVNDHTIAPYPVQLQFYGYNDLYPQMLSQRAGYLGRPLKPLLRTVSERLMVAFGYLHSEISSRVWLKRTESGRGRLQVQGELNPESERVGHAIVRKLFRIRNYFRTVPIPLQLRFDKPGGSHRSGGCFPMRNDPDGLETDLWGRIPGLRGTYVVDSSILPSIPAGPTAFTVMANAHRIASECPIGSVDLNGHVA